MVTPGKVILQAVMRYFEDCQLPGEGFFFQKLLQGSGGRGAVVGEIFGG